MPAEKQNSQEKDGAAAHGNGSELRRRDMESLSASPKPHQNGTLARSISSAFQNSEKQSPCSPTEEDTGFCPVLDQPKRDRDEYLSDDSSDDPDDPDDADYVRESGEDAHGNSVSSHRLKRASRPAVRLKPRSPRHNTERLSVGEALQSKVVADQTSTTSLHDIETIPIRGFLTRRYFCQGSYIQLPLKNRQSIPALGNQAELRHIMKTKLAASILSNPPEKGPALGKRPGQPDEERSLPWKQIAEYFPGRSGGSLQVRYCTRLKGSKAGNSGRSSPATSESSYRGASYEAVQASGGKSNGTEEGVSRQRYGPISTQATVDRYSPV
ncbi:hypothetical protein N7534_007886 [Penicillium rubens]|nr:hypothetical protein N7534_007886 [Penicillium rubens]